MSLDQNAISLQPTKFHAILALSPQWSLWVYWHPLWCYVVTSCTPTTSRRYVLFVLNQLSTSFSASSKFLSHFLRMEDPPKLKPRSSSFPSYLVPCSSLSHWVLLGLHVLLMLWARLPFYLKPKPSVLCPHGLDFLCIHGLGPLSHFGP